MRIDDYKNVVNKFTTGIVIVTGFYNNPFGITINSFSSVSLEPLLISFNIERNAQTYPLIKDSNFYNINILNSDASPLVKKFASHDRDKFEGVNYSVDKNNVPILTKNIGLLNVKKWKLVEAGDHDIVICEVLSGKNHDSKKPLIYFNSKIL